MLSESINRNLYTMIWRRKLDHKRQLTKGRSTPLVPISPAKWFFILIPFHPTGSDPTSEGLTALGGVWSEEPTAVLDLSAGVYLYQLACISSLRTPIMPSERLEPRYITFH